MLPAPAMPFLFNGADAAGAAGLLLFAAGVFAAWRAPGAGRPPLAAAALGGAVLWGLALFAAWYAWSAPARTCTACSEPLALAVNEPVADAGELLEGDPFEGLPVAP